MFFSGFWFSLYFTLSFAMFSIPPKKTSCCLPVNCTPSSCIASSSITHTPYLYVICNLYIVCSVRENGKYIYIQCLLQYALQHHLTHNIPPVYSSTQHRLKPIFVSSFYIVLHFSICIFLSLSTVYITFFLASLFSFIFFPRKSSVLFVVRYIAYYRLYTVYTICSCVYSV